MRRLALACLVMAASAPAHAVDLTVGSKSFTESVVLGEIVSRLAERAGATVRHRRALGGTRALFEALRRGDVDVYPEYTGTIAQELLAGRGIADDAAMRAALGELGIAMSRPLGFNNTYGVAVTPALAERLRLRRISDLARHPSLRLGFSNEFMDRKDGWASLRDRYVLPQRDARGLDHDLAYRGLQNGGLDAIDVYTTDAEIGYYGLVVLEDDRRHFAVYDAVLLMRADLAERAPRVVQAFEPLAGAIDERAMVALNGRVKLERVSETQAAAEFVAQRLGMAAESRERPRADRLVRNTLDHLTLVAISLAAAIVVAVPLGVVAARRVRLGQSILAAVGIVQTIPSLALLVFMIPLLGIGGPPAVVALFLYSLLPILRNTHAGLHDVAPELRESADALGLSPAAQLRLVELPLAARSILAGIKTSAVINVGTATLGALIGAGGYGQPILTGIRLDDVGLILEGAVPAALLALIVQGLFEGAERLVVPRGLRVKLRG